MKNLSRHTMWFHDDDIGGDNFHLNEAGMAACLDGRLAPDEFAVAQKHMARCPECLHEFLELKALSGKRIALPDEFLRRAGAPLRLLRMPLRSALRAAALLLAAAALGYFFYLNRPLPLRSVADAATAVRRVMPAPAVAPAAAGGQLDKCKEVAAPREIAVRKSELKAKGEKIAFAVPPAGQIATDAVAEKDGRVEEVVEVGASPAMEAAPAKALAAAPPADKQKKMEGEPRFQQRSGPSQVANQANVTLNMVHALQRDENGIVAAHVTLAGDLTLGDIRNPDVLAGLPAVDKETIVDLLVNGAGRVQRLEFRTPLARKVKRGMRSLLLKLEFPAAVVSFRHVRLIVAVHSGS